ncbi:MAG: hypothetical protein ACRC35_12870 [Angustibacter sp.]
MSIDIDQIATAVRSTPGIEELSSGAFGEVASYLPGRQVPGVRERAGRWDVHVVLRWGTPAQLAAERVRTHVHRLTSCPVDVTVADVTVADVISADTAGADVVRPDGAVVGDDTSTTGAVEPVAVVPPIRPATWQERP